MIPSLLLAALAGRCFGLGYDLEGIACLLVACITLYAMYDQRQCELAAMEPPSLGRVHFHDGYTRPIYATDPEAAIYALLIQARLSSASRRGDE